jgi:hypothetical protein
MMVNVVICPVPLVKALAEVHVVFVMADVRCTRYAKFELDSVWKLMTTLLVTVETLLMAISGPTRKEAWPAKLVRFTGIGFPRLAWHALVTNDGSI